MRGRTGRLSADTSFSSPPFDSATLKTAATPPHPPRSARTTSPARGEVKNDPVLAALFCARALSNKLKEADAGRRVGKPAAPLRRCHLKVSEIDCEDGTRSDYWMLRLPPPRFAILALVVGKGAVWDYLAYSPRPNPLWACPRHRRPPPSRDRHSPHRRRVHWRSPQFARRRRDIGDLSGAAVCRA